MGMTLIAMLVPWEKPGWAPGLDLLSLPIPSQDAHADLPDSNLPQLPTAIFSHDLILWVDSPLG